MARGRYNRRHRQGKPIGAFNRRHKKGKLRNAIAKRQAQARRRARPGKPMTKATVRKPGTGRSSQIALGKRPRRRRFGSTRRY